MSALLDRFRDGAYGASDLGADLLAGLSVALIAIPLAMALAIASGVPPQYGLNAAIVGGLLAALLGGSRFSISGPTAAFVVLLAPISARYGMAGLATAGLMAGVLLVAFAVLRLGRLIEYVPESVSLGFTAGIAIVLAMLQLNDALGLDLGSLPQGFPARLQALVGASAQLDPASVGVTSVTLAVALLWPQRRLGIPGYLPAIVVGTLLAVWLNGHGHAIATIGSRFTYHDHGQLGHGLPPHAPQWRSPWMLPGPNGEIVQFTPAVVRDLLPSAFTIAVLGAVESLLCAVVLDRATNTRHHSNGELLGQGLANLVTSFFGGVPVTAALARSAADVKAGARSPLSGVFHALFILLAVVLLGPLFAAIPMAAMAAVLLNVAWSMSEASQGLHVLRSGSASDRLVYLGCIGLTVGFDMVLAITAGCLLSAVLLMHDLARFTQVRDISVSRHYVQEPLPANWHLVKITGGLFFAAAERILREILDLLEPGSHLIIYGDGITMCDSGAVSALHRFLSQCTHQLHVSVLLTDLQPQVRQAIDASGLNDGAYDLQICGTLAQAVVTARSLAGRDGVLVA